MFECDGPRIFGIAPGEDFPKELLAGLKSRFAGLPAIEVAKAEIYVNTRRMQRRLVDLFCADGPGFLPQIKLVTDLSNDYRFDEIPPPHSALRRKLVLAQLIAKLLEKEPKLAPKANLFDLADSLAALMDEMQGEGVGPEVLRSLEVSDISGHWQHTLEFIKLIERFLADEKPGAEARQRAVVEHLIADWSASAPEHPVIVAGSTGSRGATFEFMCAVAQLPMGALVLPGFDFAMPRAAWSQLDQALTSEDQPQYRFAKLLHRLGAAPESVKAWTQQNVTDRQRLVSLALRPAPVTDQWLVEGPKLGDLRPATEGVSLIEAESPRTEAGAIAVCLREAVENGVTAALISPDRVLARHVTAALDRWGIVPDDSAGRPLALSAPGRLMRHVAALAGQNLTADVLLTVLKHPLICTGGDRGQHLLNTRELELWLRRNGPAFVGEELLHGWAGAQAEQSAWVHWLVAVLGPLMKAGRRALNAHLKGHIDATERLCAGPGASGSGALWEAAAGEAARSAIDELFQEAVHGGNLTNREYLALFETVLNGFEVRDTTLGRPDVMIWGTLEARVQGAELVVLAGLNEGTWPAPARADPWLNRALRARAGLLLPDREIGLAAHDFQQAVCAKRVVLSRALRDSEAQTVPARWLNRLTNLLGGLGATGETALANMRARGQRWVALSRAIDVPARDVTPAMRPSPRPPSESRPKEISITEVQRLIRDPYWIYARRILGLRALEPIRKTPDGPFRGTVFHNVVERYLKTDLTGDFEGDCQRFGKTAVAVLEERAGWPTARQIWQAQLDRLAEWFVAGEYDRQSLRRPIAIEANGRIALPNSGVVLKGKIDRVDRDASGAVAIYDYKTGTIPTADQQLHFDKQLLLSALIIRHGKSEGTSNALVEQVGYIGLKSKPVFNAHSVDAHDVDTVLAELDSLLVNFGSADQGYTSRRAVETQAWPGDFDHLARYGEWDESDDPQPEVVGR